MIRKIKNLDKSIVILLSLIFVLFVFTGTGCKSPDQYKQEADEEVYDIINEKWKPDFSSQTNYKINDVNKAPDSLPEFDPNQITGKLTLADSLAIATSNNRDYQRRKEQLYLVALDLTFERHRFTKRWFGTVDTDYQKTGVNRGSTSEDESVSANSDFGFNRLLKTGGLISIDLANNWSSFLTGNADTSFSSVLSASFTQPLLRGAWEEVAAERLTQAERNALYQIRSFNRFRKEFLVSVVSEYFRVLQQKDAVTNAKNNLERRIESQKRLELEAEVGRKPAFEVDQARQSVLEAEDSYVRAQQRYEGLLDDFKIRLAIPTDANIILDQNELTDLKDKGIVEVDFTLENALDTGLTVRLDLANSADFVDDAQRKVIVAADGLEADLDFFVDTSVPSSGDTRAERLRFHEGTYNLGLESDLPFDRKSERNTYRESLIELQRTIREYNEEIDLIKLEIRDAYRNLKEAAQRYYIQKNSLELARQRVESTSFLLELGRVSTRDLLEAQDALLQAENSLSEAVVDHLIEKLNFFKDVGIMQVRPDGSWNLPENNQRENT